MLLKEKLRSILDYNQDTGVFVWRIAKRGLSKGSIAGNTRPDQYRRIVIDGKCYYAHRLAWMHVYGYFPKNQIDHINRNPNDNRITNLRLATQKQNLENTSKSQKNTSGFKGVSWIKKTGKFRAFITHNQKYHHLGVFDTAIEAKNAYAKAAQKIFTHAT
jgi:hypothetical protein